MIAIGVFLLVVIIIGCGYWYSQEQKSNKTKQ